MISEIKSQQTSLNINKPQIFLIHFAGGGGNSYDFMNMFLKDFAVIPLELPGRGRRTREALLCDFELAAKDIYNQILIRLNSSVFVIYGHSMGAYLGYQVVRSLEKVNKFPRCLIVSGNPGPGVNINKKRHNLGDADFIEELKKLGGTPSEVYNDRDLWSYFEPILRADFEISEENGISENTLINTPIYALMGDEEENVSKITRWRQFTNSTCKFKIFKGNHFFIHNYPKEISMIIRNCIYQGCDNNDKIENALKDTETDIKAYKNT